MRRLAAVADGGKPSSAAVRVLPEERRGGTVVVLVDREVAVEVGDGYLLHLLADESELEHVRGFADVGCDEDD